MKKVFFVLFFCSLVNLFANNQEEFQFFGRHLLISYCDCDEDALLNNESLNKKMHEAAIASGVHVLSSSEHAFEPQGFTQILLLSESHASIHTYPEMKSCFVDLFTCGDGFAMDQFDKIMSEYLKPNNVSHKFFQRRDDIEEIAYTSPYKTQNGSF